MKTKAIISFIFLVSVVYTGLGFSQSKSTENITREEAAVFWEKFKSFCHKKEILNIQKFVDESVLYQRVSFGDVESQTTYSLERIKGIVSSERRDVDIIPVWTEKMNNVLIDKSVSQNLGESGNLYWAYGASNDNPNIYIYITGKNGPASYRNVYFFYKKNGSIKLFKVISEEL